MWLGKSKQAFILVGFLLLSISVLGQTGRSIKYRFDGDLKEKFIVTGNRSLIINYALPEINIENITNSNGIFYRITAPGHSLTVDPGKPELPVLNRLINIPEGTSFKIRISDIKSSRIIPSGNNIKGLLFPAQHGETKQKDSQKTGFVLDKELYSRHGFIKSDTVRIESLGKMRGKELSNLVISPVRYDPGSNYIEVITSMKIEISFSEDIINFSKSSLSESALFNETFDKGILNYFPSDFMTGYSDQPVEMIILTDTAFRKYLEPFYKWKIQKGFKLSVLYKGAGMAGSNYTELKKTISDVYSSSSSAGHPPEYLLIIGDIKRIPYYGSDGSGNITDMYYGEFDGNGDYLPDMYIGRIPATDTNSVKSVVQKLLEYEKFQFADTNKFYSRALELSGKDAGYANYMNGQIKYAVTNYLTPANKINEYHFYYPDGYTKKDSVMKLISKGLSFINYTGHGSLAGWLHLDIKSQDVKNFNNRSMYPFVISNACRTAQFNDTTSLGNKMVVASGEGAIGFIGCSNDSYWDEDFCWAVGSGTPNSDPKYEQTGLGAFDRLFHTHNELPSDWYITMGQINFAGNMAVSSTSSLKKKYYWETYTLLGDPSIIPIIGTPQPFSFSLPDTLPNGIRSVSLTIDPFAYVAVSHFDTLWDASFASPSGSVMLDLPGLSNDSCLVVITGQNRIPIIKTIYFSDITREYINLSGSGINDISENNNGKADYGEAVFLKLKISNLGLTSATNLTATISSTSPWVTINDNRATIGTLVGKSEIIVDNNIQLTIDDDVPDQGIITIDLTLKDNRIEKKYKIDITLHAPKLEIVNCIIDDSEYGNNNFIIDPGENFRFIFQVKNTGSSNASGQLIIDDHESGIEIVNSDIKSGILQFGEVSEISVPAKLSSSAQYGDYIDLMSVLDCSPYIVDQNFEFRVGRVRESFESSTFTVYPWINISNKPWTISGSHSVDGGISARSGSISHNATTVLFMRTYFPQPDTLKFYYKVSSEPNYDYLQFNLNDKEVLKYSGETSWEKFKIAVPAGFNLLEWIYRKDNSVSQGADGAWIDKIDFSGSTHVNYIQRDIELARIVTPVQKEVYGKELVSVKVLNLGSDTLNGFNLAYSINGRLPVIQNFKTSLIPYDDSVTVTFDRRADLDLNGTYEILVYSYENNDNYLPNDSLMIRIQNTEIEESVTIFPNPFTEQLNIIMNSKETRNVRISLTNVSGRKVYSADHELTEGENQLVINTIHLSPALYILTINGSGGSKAYSLIKLKQ
jgi:hypothetical protein